MLVDLHLHSTCSDGVYTPEDIVEKAVAANLKAIALTDHDNVEGYLRARSYIDRQHYDLQLLGGVEIDTDYEQHGVHILGYYFDPEYQPLLEAMQWMREGRVRRIQKMVEKLQALHYAITFEQVQAEADTSKSIGRPHVARTLVKKGYFSDVKAVFDALLARGKPAYCSQEKLTQQEAVALLHAAGGLAVLAHPGEVKSALIVEHLLQNTAFDVLEVWHPSSRAPGSENAWHTWQDWLAMAKKYKLLISGGSDFHGTAGRYPACLGEFKVNYQDVAAVVTYQK